MWKGQSSGSSKCPFDANDLMAEEVASIIKVTRWMYANKVVVFERTNVVYDQISSLQRSVKTWRKASEARNECGERS